MIHVRVLLFAWLVSAVTCATWSLFHGWAGWPSEAQTYARWVAYQLSVHLPLALWAALVGMGFLLAGAALLFIRYSLGSLIFCVGLLLHAYSCYSAIPIIASSTELSFRAVFYLLSGLVLGVSYSNRRYRHVHPKEG